MRNDPQQVQPLALEAAPGEVRDEIDFGAEDLVQNDADDFDAFPLKQRLVQRNFINGPADAALGDNDDFRAEDLGNLGVGQVKHRPDARMAGTFTKHKILLPGHTIKRLLYLTHQNFVIG